MKKLICTLAVLLLSSSVANAEYGGILVRGRHLDFVVAAASTKGGAVAVTVSYLGPRGLDFDTFTIRPGESITETEFLPKSATRMIVDVDTAPGGFALFRVSDPSIVLEESIRGHARYVFDIVD